MVSHFRVKEVICFGEGAGANILARFAVSTVYFSNDIAIFFKIKNETIIVCRL